MQTNPSRNAVQDAFDNAIDKPKGKPDKPLHVRNDNQGGGKSKSQKRRLILDGGGVDVGNTIWYDQFISTTQMDSLVGTQTVDHTSPFGGGSNVVQNAGTATQQTNYMQWGDANQLLDLAGMSTWTLQWFDYFQANTGYNYVLQWSDYGTAFWPTYTQGDWAIQVYPNGDHHCVFCHTTGASHDLGIGTTINTWMHWAVVNDGTDLKLYKNGTLAVTVASHSFTTERAASANLELTVFSGDAAGDNGDFDGAIADLHITPDVLYTGNFTAPTAPQYSTVSYGNTEDGFTEV